MSCESKRPQRRGVAATELTILLPLILLLTFGIVDFGRVMHFAIALTNATRTGAERGAMEPFTSLTYADWEQRVVEAVREEIGETIGIDSADILVTVTTTVDACDLVQVRVQADYTFVSVVTWPGVPNSIDLSRSVTMRQLR